MGLKIRIGDWGIGVCHSEIGIGDSAWGLGLGIGIEMGIRDRGFGIGDWDL